MIQAEVIYNSGKLYIHHLNDMDALMRLERRLEGLAVVMVTA